MGWKAFLSTKAKNIKMASDETESTCKESQIKNFCTNILPAVARSIQNGSSLQEISSMLVESENFKSAVLSWRDPESSLNLFQWTIVNKRCDALKLLHQQYPAFLSGMVTTSGQLGQKCASFELEYINSPLHLACWVGDVNIFRYLLDSGCGPLVTVTSVISLKQISSNPTMFTTAKVSKSPRGKPFEFAVSQKHLDCVQFMLDNVIIQSVALRFLYAGVREPSSLLHKACSIGSGKLVSLLLKQSFRDIICLSDKNGKTPLHTAAWNGDTETIEQLLENGADVNALTESRSCLHIMYRSKLHPYNYVKNTALLLQYGIDCHVVDKNGKSALHIMAEEIGISRVDVIQYWRKAAEAISEMTSSSELCKDYTTEQYQSDLVQCLCMLLEHGGDPNQRTFPAAGMQTVLEVLLQYSSLPYTHTMLWHKPGVLYAAVSLLLENGADPNALTSSSETAICSLFLGAHVHEISDVSMQIQFINLFCQHGYDPDSLSPKQTVLSIFLLLRRHIDLQCVQLLANYMTVGKLEEARASVLNKLVPMLLRSSYELDVQYGHKLREKFFEMTARSLRHMSKLAILRQLNRRASQVQKLPLSGFLKTYLTSDAF
ncbi:ankyrin-3-like isoform X2 [Pomacea canaliculata]|uniref:ankyrin-3-like isoform X2 n=1 Tax=Pomacea canaliculata TaxID=400727 RepID=UPI000D72FF13|nr:ankyrin-3-like isoform X2 [Pomacea canaliculata]